MHALSRYYEWKQLDKREKQPYYFYREGSVMKVRSLLSRSFSLLSNIVDALNLCENTQFAGLYDTWKSEGGEEMYSCTILTTAIAPELKWLHTRMPVRTLVTAVVLHAVASLAKSLIVVPNNQVILDDGGVARWLSDTKFESLKDLLVSYRGADLKYHPVDKRSELSLIFVYSIITAASTDALCLQLARQSSRATTAPRRSTSSTQVAPPMSVSCLIASWS